MMEESWRRRRPQGGTRRRKRSNTRGGGATDQNKIRCTPATQNSNGSSTFRFDVEIPNYYSNTTQPATQQQQISVTDDGINNQNRNSTDDAVNETSVSAAGNTESDELHTEQQIYQAPGEGDTNKESAAKNKTHDDFISALEKHGTSEGAWVAMASDLKWSVEDVKVYAYSYFKDLVQDRKAKYYGKFLDKKGDRRDDEKKEKNETSSKAGKDKEHVSWTFYELVLLDSLMVKYCKDLNCLDVKNASRADESSPYWIKRRSVWEKIASQFPGKSAFACKKEGFARLLKSYDERQCLL